MGDRARCEFECKQALLAGREVIIDRYAYLYCKQMPLHSPCDIDIYGTVGFSCLLGQQDSELAPGATLMRDSVPHGCVLAMRAHTGGEPS